VRPLHDHDEISVNVIILTKSGQYETKATAPSLYSFATTTRNSVNIIFKHVEFPKTISRYSLLSLYNLFRLLYVVENPFVIARS
jgi:hypothetical protein